jgi:hypothetical protein
MEKNRSLTVHFMDGTSISFDFPPQARNEVARKLLLEDIVKSPFLMVSADGSLLMFPVANIKSIQMFGPADGSAAIDLPPHVIRGATVVG